MDIIIRFRQTKIGKYIISFSFLSFLSSFLIFFGYACIQGIDTVYFDSDYYWNIGDSVFSGGFDLFAFPRTFRGYFLPVLYSIIKKVGRKVFHSEMMGLWIFVAVIMATTLTVVLPSFFNLVVNSWRDFWGLMACCGLLLFFWGDFFLYPLSDMPAIAFMSAGVMLLKRALENLREGKKPYITALICGMCLYTAYNIRATYVYGVVLIVLCMLFFYFKEKNVIKLLIVCLVGGFIIAAPQMAINAHYTGRYSPRVLTEQYSDVSANLQTVQVYWGPLYSRYESFIGNTSDYPYAAVNYVDPVGTEIFKREGVTVENFSFSRFFKLIIKYPLDFAGIYTRHLVSLLTPLFSQVYISEIVTVKVFRLLFIIILWLCWGIYTIYVKDRTKCCKVKDVIIIIGLLIPSVLQFFGAPEIRFFFAVHLLLYFYICFCLRWKDLWGYFKGHVIQCLFPCVVIFFAWCSMIGSILQEVQESVQLISDYPAESYQEREVEYSLVDLDIPDSED